MEKIKNYVSSNIKKILCKGGDSIIISEEWNGNVANYKIQGNLPVEAFSEEVRKVSYIDSSTIHVSKKYTEHINIEQRQDMKFHYYLVFKINNQIDNIVVKKLKGTYNKIISNNKHLYVFIIMAFIVIMAVRMIIRILLPLFSF